MEIDETLQQAALRELEEETGVRPDGVLPGPVFDAVQRDPRGRVLSVPYVSVVLAEDVDPERGSDASDARFFPLSSLPQTLAFDHLDIIAAICPVATAALRAGRLAPSLSAGERERIAGIIERDVLMADDAPIRIG